MLAVQGLPASPWGLRQHGPLMIVLIVPIPAVQSLRNNENMPGWGRSNVMINIHAIPTDLPDISRFLWAIP